VASDCFFAQDNVGGWETGTLSWWSGVSSGRWWTWPLIALLLRIMLEDGKLGLYPGGAECPPVIGGVVSDCFIAQDNAGGWETGTLSWWNGVSSGGWWEWPAWEYSCGFSPSPPPTGS
jgi:hypothetical protein